MLNYLHYNITSQIPNVRYQVQSLFKKALDRFNAGLKVIEKNIATINSKINAVEGNKLILRLYIELHKSYKMFLRNLTKQLISYLSYDSNYPRRVITLNLLVNINGFMVHDEWLNCWTSFDVKCCYNILFDGYESNKKLALRLLENLPIRFIGFTVSRFLYNLYLYYKGCTQNEQSNRQVTLRISNKKGREVKWHINFFQRYSLMSSFRKTFIRVKIS